MFINHFIVNFTNINTEMPAIQLSLIDDTSFLFNADGIFQFIKCEKYLCSKVYLFFHFIDYMTIRTEHRIVGRLVGNSVKWPRNLSIKGKHFTLFNGL